MTALPPAISSEPLPDAFPHGEIARLFPPLSESNRERRIVSIFLAMLPRVPALGTALLSTAGFKVGKRTKMSAFTEVVHVDGPDKRVDGLIVARTGSAEWRALLEAKIEKSVHSADQINGYLDLAKNDVDAFITISNEFVARADHPVVEVKANLLKKVQMCHWSWTFIATQCEIILYQTDNLDEEQAFLLHEFLRLLDHPKSGVERFKHMPQSWKDLVEQIALKKSLRKTDPVVTETAEAWIQEIRDLSLMMTRHVGQEVTSNFSRAATSKDLVDRVSRDVVGNNPHLRTSLTVPGAASKIAVDVDLARKSISVSMQLKAPTDKKSTKARVNWLVRMVDGSDDRAHVTAYWPASARTTMAPLAALREDPAHPDLAVDGKSPTKFDLEFHEGTRRRFAGSRTFIEDLERIVREFYDFAGQHLRAFQPPPPKPVKARDEGTAEAAALSSSAGHRQEETEKPSSEDGATGFLRRPGGWFRS